MELLDRYLQEIRRWLPAEQQDDIIAEISDAVQSQFEARQAELHRPLTSDEEVAIIKAFGHPKIVASRYRSPQFLIGPDSFPFYWYTLRLVLVIVLSVELLVALVAGLISQSPLATFTSSVAVMWPSIFLLFGTVTFIFAAIERASPALAKEFGTRWNPRSLARPGSTEISRFSTLFEAIVNIITLMFLLDVPYVRHAAGAMMGPGLKNFAPFSLTPNWQVFFTLTVIAIAVVVIQDFVLLIYPTQRRLRAAALLLANILMIAAACAMLPAHSYISVSDAITARAPHVAATLNEIAYASFVILAVAWAVAAAFNVRALFKRAEVPNFNISYNGIH